MENRVLTILFVDMEGFTKRSAKQTLDEVKAFHDELQTFIAEQVKKHSGVLVKSLGDGFIIRFDSPTIAVQASLDIHKEAEIRNAKIGNPNKSITFRIGINTGDVAIDEKGDLFGDPVNMTSRIQSFGQPKEVLLSEATYLSMNRNGFEFDDLGPQMFKNATREIKVYRVRKEGTKPAEANTPAPPPGKPSFWKTKWGNAVTVLFFLVIFTKVIPGIFRAVDRKVNKPMVTGNPATPQKQPVSKPAQPPVSAKPETGSGSGPNEADPSEEGGDDDKQGQLDFLKLDLDNLPKGVRMPPKALGALKQMQSAWKNKNYQKAIEAGENLLQLPAIHRNGQSRVRALLVMGRLQAEAQHPKEAAKYLNDATGVFPAASERGKKTQDAVDEIRKEFKLK